MSLGFWQIAIVVLLLVLLFGRGKISELMGDMARGIKSFKQGIQDDEAISAPRREMSEAEPAVRKDEAAKT